MLRTLPLLFLTLTLAATSVLASQPLPDSRAAQSFETCSMITSEYITVLQLIKRGFTGNLLIESLPDIDSSGAERVKALDRAVREDGLEETFSAVNVEYARCSRRVYKARGKPDPDKREGHFYFCAGENKLRYEILIAATLHADLGDVLRQVPQTRHRISRAIYDLQSRQGTLAAFDAIGDELKFCLNGKS